MEQILSGYCRSIDASRMVMLEDDEPDCEYEACSFREVCQIGQQLTHLLTKTEEHT